MNPIAKSFTPLISRHFTLTAATYYYPNNMPTTLIPGLPLIMGEFLFFNTYLLIYLPSITTYHLYEMGAM
jgi:hypothetical protein